jgi:hypothetical protein
LALSQVAKEALFISRLLNELHVDLDTRTVTIKCDNKQTIQLVTKEVSRLQTKLQHVNIHNHWIRQEVSNGNLQVQYVPSADMITDGLTKVLPTNKWDSFLDQLGLVQAKATEEMNPVALEEIQAQLDNLAIA